MLPTFKFNTEWKFLFEYFQSGALVDRYCNEGGREGSCSQSKDLFWAQARSTITTKFGNTTHTLLL